MNLKPFVTLAILTSIVSVISSPIAIATEKTIFSDVSNTSTYKDGIEYLSSLGIVNGNPDGTYKPSNTLNRAEMLKILTIANIKNTPLVPATKCFEDVPTTEWYAPYVCYGKEQSWVIGYDNGKNFKPEQTVTVVEALKMTLESFNIEYNQNSDIWYKGIVNTASSNNYIPFDVSGFTAGLRRDQMADMVTRIIKKSEGKLSEYLGERSKIVVSYDSIESDVNSGEKVDTQEASKTITVEQLQKDSDTTDMEVFNANQSSIISIITTKIDSFYTEEKDVKDFMTTITNTMNKYSDSSLIQQSGQKLIDESNNLLFILEKLIGIGNNIIQEANTQMGTGIVTSSQKSLVDQFTDYVEQRKNSNDKITSQIETFVMNEKTVLQDKLDKKQDELERKQKAKQIQDSLLLLTQDIDNQLSTLNSQIIEKNAEMDAIYALTISMVKIQEKIDQITPEYNNLIDQWNSLVEAKQKIAALSYKIDDYYNLGTIPSAEDQAFLKSLGISF